MRKFVVISFFLMSSLNVFAASYDCVGSVNTDKKSFLMERDTPSYSFGQIDFPKYFISIDENTHAGASELTINFFKRGPVSDDSIAVATGVTPPTTGKSFNFEIQNDGNALRVSCVGK